MLVEFEILGFAIGNTAKNTNKEIRETDQGIRNPVSGMWKSRIQDFLGGEAQE